MTYLIISNILLDVLIVFFLLKANQAFRKVKFSELTFTVLVLGWLVAVAAMVALWRATFGLNIF